MIVLGFSGIEHGEFYRRHYGLRMVGHDAAVALFVDGVPVFAIEEERLSRRKHTSRLPIHGVKAALEYAGLGLGDVDSFAYIWHASAKNLASMFLRHPCRIPVQHWPQLAVAGSRVVRDLMCAKQVGKSLASFLDEPSILERVVSIPHHLTHAACSFYSSPFEDAAILTVDGQGEDESATLGEYSNAGFQLKQRIPTPDSIGILYGMVTDFLGLRSAWDEYKVMGMAAHGDPRRFAGHFKRLVRLKPKGKYRTHRTAMVFRPGYCDSMLARVFGIPPRLPETPFSPEHFDIAAALQSRTEEVLFHLLERLRQVSTARNLCLGGGVFQNSVANGKILRRGLFDRIHVPPVPGDHGGAYGAAAVVSYERFADLRPPESFTAFSGPAYTDAEMEAAMADADLEWSRPPDIVARTASLLADNKIVGWFRGRAEYGPRALGHRSILASPLRVEMRDLVNNHIKHRESFRPFAGSVPNELASIYFDLEAPSPFMQFVVPVHSSAQNRIPAVVHHGTCRAHTVDRSDDNSFWQLLHAFGQLTSVPVLLNTSFNDADEPIVCSPEDACRTFQKIRLDVLVLGPFLARPRKS